MKRYRWQLWFGVGLVVLSVIVYGFHYACFRDMHHILIYLVGDIAFVPIEVLMVTLVLHELLSAREKKARLHKLNMAVGVFFSEVGTGLLTEFRKLGSKEGPLGKGLDVSGEWSDREFDRKIAAYSRGSIDIACRAEDLGRLRTFLAERRAFLLGLLENPNLLEHESFTDLLWAVFHLCDELSHRKDVMQLPQTDVDHLAGDIKRAYARLVGAWLGYMKHLKADYPYLFSLALRTSPFALDPDPVVK